MKNEVSTMAMAKSDAQNQIVTGEASPINDGFIESRIFTIRGVQVMFDRDLAVLYGVETRVLNQAVKRNADRFPSDLMFQVEASEVAAAVAKGYSDQTCSRSQFVTLNRGRGQNIKYKPCAFTEHGIIMLASVLRSHEATQVLRIVRAFVAMRKFILANAQVFQRIESVEQRQIATEGKVNEILNRLNVGDVPSQGVFYNGQLWDARGLVLKLIQSAKRSLILIDNWANTEVLDLFTKKRKGVRLTIFTSEHYDKKHVPHRKISLADVVTFNAQYPKLAVRYNETFHDRFLIIDDKELYLIGASLKDLGSKCFAFTKLDPADIRRIKKTAFAAP